jgi:hypothetical protein
MSGWRAIRMERTTTSRLMGTYPISLNLRMGVTVQLKTGGIRKRLGGLRRVRSLANITNCRSIANRGRAAVAWSSYRNCLGTPMSRDAMVHLQLF